MRIQPLCQKKCIPSNGIMFFKEGWHLFFCSLKSLIMTSHEKLEIQSGYKPTDQSLGVMFCVDLVAYGCCWIHPDFLLEICLTFKRPYPSLTYRHSLSWSMRELVISEYFLFHSWWFQSSHWEMLVPVVNSPASPIPITSPIFRRRNSHVEMPKE